MTVLAATRSAPEASTMGGPAEVSGEADKGPDRGEEGPRALPGFLRASIGLRRTGAAGLCLSWMRLLVEGSAESHQ